MGFFWEDTSKEAYDNADEAVNRGNPTPEQRRLNERRAKVAGSWGRKGSRRAARQAGEVQEVAVLLLNWWSSASYST